MKKTIVMKEVFEAADLKELEGFTIQSVTNPNEDLIMLSLTNTEGKKAEILIPPEETHSSGILDDLQEGKAESKVYYLDHLSTKR